MKKNVLLILFTFVINISIPAQIQRRFFDFQLSKTTKSEAVAYFENKGKKCNVVDDIVVVENVRFGGVDWYTAFFAFYNNRLSTVSFTISEETTPKESLDKIYSNLIESLTKKYSTYYNAPMSDYEASVYKDAVTDVLVRYTKFEGVYSLCLMYSDLEAMRAQKRKDLDEL